MGASYQSIRQIADPPEDKNLSVAQERSSHPLVCDLRSHRGISPKAYASRRGDRLAASRLGLDVSWAILCYAQNPGAAH
jgi:hypothetical protein